MKWKKRPVAVTCSGSDERLHSVLFHWKAAGGEAFLWEYEWEAAKVKVSNFLRGRCFLVNLIHLKGKKVEKPRNYL